MARATLIHAAEPRAAAERPRRRSVPMTFVRAIERFWHHGDLFSAAAISYYAIFSLLPLAILLLVSLQVVFPADRVVRNAGRLFGGLTDTNIIITTVKAAYKQQHSAGVTSIVVLVIAATGVFTAVQLALDRIWESRGRILHHRWVIGAVMMALSLLIYLGILLLTIFVFRLIRSSELGVWLGWPRTPQPGTGGAALAIATSVAQFGIFWTLYRFLTNAYVRWRDTWPGALVATLVWHVAGYGLNVYLTRIADFGSLYHQVQAIMALLVWVYGLVCSFLFGAEFTVQWKLAETNMAQPTTPETSRAAS